MRRRDYERRGDGWRVRRQRVRLWAGFRRGTRGHRAIVAAFAAVAVADRFIGRSMFVVRAARRGINGVRIRRARAKLGAQRQQRQEYRRGSTSLAHGLNLGASALGVKVMARISANVGAVAAASLALQPSAAACSAKRSLMM